MKTRITFLLLLLYQLGDCQSVEIYPNALNNKLIDVQSVNKGVLTPRLSSSQRMAIAGPSGGLLVYDTTTNSLWYFNGTTWEEISTVTGANQWLINGANQYSINSGSVGINTNLLLAKFETEAYYRTQGIFGSAYAGISLAANPPAIGFNIYNDSTNTNRHLTQGYGFLQEFDPFNGKFSFIPQAYQNKDSATVQTAPPYYLTNIGQFGSGFVSSLSAQTRFFNKGFSRFGENAPKIKCRVYTGTTTDEELYNNDTGQFEYSHFTRLSLEISSSKILKISIVIECGGSRPYVPPNQCGNSFYGNHCYRYYLDANGVLRIVHEGESSLETYSKPFKVFIIYAE